MARERRHSTYSRLEGPVVTPELQKIIDICEPYFDKEFESYTFLALENPSQVKEDFLKDSEKRHPDFEYHKLNDEHIAKFKAEIEKFNELKVRIESEIQRIKKDTTKAKELVLWYLYLNKVDQAIKERELLLHAKNNDMTAFKEASEAVWGMPQQETLFAVLYKLEEAFDSDKADKVADLKSKLSRLFESKDYIKAKNKLKSADTVKAVINTVRESIDSRILALEIPDSEDISGEAMSVYIKQALLIIGAEDWTVELIEGTALSVNSGTKVVKVPRERSLKLNHKKAKRLIIHEVATHVLRAVNAATTGLTILESGLAGYLPGEEAVATLRENSLKAEDKQDLIGLTDQYLAIALASGIDGVKRDFRDVFELLTLVKLAKRLTEDGKTYTLENARKKAYDVTLRAFRGTDMKDNNAPYTKDISYLEGRIALARTLEDNPGLAAIFDIGKFNPSDIGHIYALYTFGLIDIDIPKHKN